MCGIVGLYLKTSSLKDRLGAMFTPMLIEMTDRGPDSAGVAVYHAPASEGQVKITAFHPDPGFDWAALAEAVSSDLGVTIEHHANDTHHVLISGGEAEALEDAIEDYDPLLQVMSAGTTIEIYKETGLPEEVAEKFGLKDMKGSHAVGHTRMATESAVTTAGSHPFSTGLDLCLVHNGSLSNHNRLREHLATHRGIEFKTENDTEVAAAYVSDKMNAGRSLHEALEDSIKDLDGFYTFVVGTRDGFAVLRDPIACKPAVLAETDDYVAFASEYRALVDLPGIETAKVWEPEPAVVYSWGGRA
ncbi:class II glutamine amidotransferase [Denitrobaculum tricleocarpae]|uniref:Amidophosphoribosyltransferase n=1 Tax=Denitrobaculum tricleocarpae TaxID=2591009 RepID=A0A545TX33_9PROT|nr:glutamine amidotransferase family protein [Denitrobaculum tricleocarpae]TQV81773.1 amidophosphoribosyltransferase [Denitrobaculum tricleocarpae]